MTTPRGGGRVNLHTIYEELQARIRAGAFSETGQLPSTAKLATEFGISTPSVQKVIRQLRTAGLVTSQPGVGVFVQGAAPKADARAGAPEAGDAEPRMTLNHLVQDLEHRIRAGEFDDGGKLPSMAALAQRYDMTGESVRRALRSLEDMGLVEGRQGVGVFVVHRPLYPWVAHSESGDDAESAWQEAVISSGSNPRHAVVEVGEQAPPRSVAQELGLAEGATAFVRRTVHLVDDRPVQVGEHWFPESLARGTALADPQPLPSVRRALAQLGSPQARHVDRVQSALASPAEAVLLQLRPGTVCPVTRCLRTGFDQVGAVVRVSVTTARADAEERVYELPG